MNAIGEIVAEYWVDLPNHFPGVHLDATVVMPNHMHGIVVINPTDADGIYAVPTNDHVGTRSNASEKSIKRPTLGVIVGTFKAAVTRHINREVLYSPDMI